MVERSANGTGIGERVTPDPRFRELLEDRSVEERVEAGEITSEQANEELQEAARRLSAEHGPALDTDAEGRVTTGGFGSGQGMGNQRTGQDPT